MDFSDIKLSEHSNINSFNEIKLLIIKLYKKMSKNVDIFFVFIYNMLKWVYYIETKRILRRKFLMYERSAIVLERFFDNLLGFNQVNNLKKNFNNYCELFEKFKVLQTANAEEIAALKEFQDAENRIEEIQNQEEKLYKKSAKLQYNRDLIFQDISQKPDEIEKCSLKIESDLQKNHDKLVALREEFVNAVSDYNEKKSTLSKCKKTRKKAENEYNIIFDETNLNLENISEEYITIAKEFSISEIQSDIISALSENGKAEKIPFNNQVITNAAQIGFDIKTREVESYLEAYKLAQKLIKELLDGAVSMELHEKKIKNISVKFNFLEAEKDYIVGFLDYERITVIYGKRMHRTLMIDACEKLEKDIEQIENLYKIILKEIAGKSTKKAYKELYNKSYLMEIEDKDAKFKKEKNRVNLSTGTIMNSNYWRIEGIKNIYTVFYKNVVDVFGRDLDEFEIPEDQDLDENIFEEEQEESATIKQVVSQKPKKEKVEIIDDSSVEDKVKIQKAVSEELDIKVDSALEQIDSLDNESESNNEFKKTLKLATIVKKRGRKKLKHYTRQIVTVEEKEQAIDELEEHIKEPAQIVNIEDTTEVLHEEKTEDVIGNSSEDFDIFGERYQNIDSQIAELEDLEEYKISKAQAKEIDFNDIEETSIFESMEEDNENFDIIEIDLDKDFKKKKSKNKIFGSFKKLNSKSKKKLANE